MKGFYFLATCQYLDPNLGLDIAMKMRPYGGLIGIDNSSLDLYFKSYKILRLHAMLHDASGFVFEYSEKGPGYSYVLPCPVTNEYPGQVKGVAFCLYVKTFKSNLNAKTVCWNVEITTILDFEGFRHKELFYYQRLFYLWLTNESTVRESRTVFTSSELVPKFSGLQLYSG